MNDDRRWYAWGCGKIANSMMERYSQFKDNISPELGVVPEIQAFIDTDPQKQGTIFWGRPVCSPEKLKQVQGDVGLVISTKYAQEIKHWIDESGLGNLKEIIKSADFLYIIQQKIIENSREILDANTIHDENFYKCVITSEKLKLIQENDTAALASIFGEMTPSEIIESLYFNYLDRTENLASMMKKVKFPKKRRKEKSVGLICNRLSIGGAERVVSILSDRLARIGYSVVIITEMIEESEYLISKEVNREIIDKSFSGNMRAYLKEYERIIKKYELNSICFHIPYEGNDYLYKLLFFKLCGLQVFTEMHTSVANFTRRWNGLSGHDVVFRLNDCLVTLSEEDSRFWQKLGVRSVYIPNPVSESLIQPITKRKREKSKILWVGRISQSIKRVLDTVDIFAWVEKKVPAAELYIVGTANDMREMDKLKELVHVRGFDEQIHICGYQENVSEYYQSSDVFLMTSPGEGFPMVLLEAMAYSLPVVMYELPYLEVVKNQKGIISVAQKDKEGAARAISKLLVDEELYEEKSYESWNNAQFFISYDVGAAWDRLFREGYYERNRID